MSSEPIPAADGPVPGAATPPEEPADPWGVCDVLLVADRSHGATHKVFGAWRFEAVMRSGRPAAGSVLVAVPVVPADLADSGWRYEFRIEPERPGDGGRPTFSWKATTTPATPDPLAAAQDGVCAWLTAHGWEQDPQNRARYHA